MAADYNFEVARGWESKNVEDQQAEAGRQPAKHRAPLSRSEAARLREMDSLRLSRNRVVQQMEASTSTRHRALLQLELDALDEKLRAFDK